MGLGLEHRRHYPPRFAERRRQQSPQRETLTVLDWILQDTRCWSAQAADTPDGRHLRDHLFYLDLPSNLSGALQPNPA